jgi:hypothetical protein
VGALLLGVVLPGLVEAVKIVEDAVLTFHEKFKQCDLGAG